ncbi:MAG TPA: hypothetical protein VMZ69_01525 [Saprospiraceae bacterium]|nr:hypothetical protein [Saprospiraceae bacterium]
MKTFQTIISILIGVFYSTLTFSQTVGIEIPSSSKPHRFSFSVTQGRSHSNTGRDLLKGMENSGLNDRTPIIYHPATWWSRAYASGGESYPKKKETNSYLNFQARYDLTLKSAMAVNWSTTMNATVEGYERVGESGNFLTLDSKIKILTLEYILRIGTGWSGISVGPAVVFHNVARQPLSDEINLYQHKAIKPGIHLGYTWSFIKNSNWIVAANVQYNWFSKDVIDPITIEGEFTSVYAGQPVSLSNIGLGITSGFRF